LHATSLQQTQTIFLGYDQAEADIQIVKYRKVKAKGKESYQLVFNQTPFYPEGGGQIGDTGFISNANEKIVIVDTKKENNLIIHFANALPENVDANFTASIDDDKRKLTENNHTATHLLHAALRQVLGPSALQSGSYNKPGYMRLDFSWNESLSQSSITEIEEVANLAIRQDLAVQAEFMSVEEAKASGAIALFGETYDELVRVIQIGGPWSRELCGGTHVSRSSQVGLVSILGEASVGSGSRRLEALVGFEAFQALSAEAQIVGQILESLRVPKQELAAKVRQTLEHLKIAEKKLAALALESFRSQIPAVIKSVKTFGRTRTLPRSF
jgi:alanyl-tRNA synthetase